MATATTLTITEAPVHPNLATADLARAKAWFAEKVGWQPILEPEGTLVYEVGDSHFTVYRTVFAGSARNTVMNWNVPDIGTEVARLRARGVTFENYDFGEIRTVDGIMTDPTGGKTAWFKDPDGNSIAILQAAGGGPGHSLSAMIAAADLERAKAWYADKLGFEPVAEFPGFVMDYRSGNTSFNVYKTDFAGTAKGTVAIWRLKGIGDEVARLKARGVVFEEYDFGDEGSTVGGILSDDEGEVNAWFKDCEGNILALAEDRA